MNHNSSSWRKIRGTKLAKLTCITRDGFKWWPARDIHRMLTGIFKDLRTRPSA